MSRLLALFGKSSCVQNLVAATEWKSATVYSL